MHGWIDQDTFQFWMPAQAIISKGDKKDEKGKRWIQGIASTDGRDLQGEIVEQKGIDFSYFMKYGYFNNDHKPGFANKVGQPTECRLTKNGLWVKGYLFKEKSVADDIWEMLHSLDASGSSRRLGFSIQGKVKRREGNMIKECWIQDVAVTPAPVNTATWAEIAKSLSAQKWDLSKNNEEEDEEKALSAGVNNPLVPESLEGDKKENRTSKSMLTFNETVSFLQESENLPKEAAIAVAKAVFETC